jgi:hypothetical protein
MPSVRGQGLVQDRRDTHLDHRPLRGSALHKVGKGPFQIIQGRTQVNRRPMVRPGRSPGRHRKFGRPSATRLIFTGAALIRRRSIRPTKSVGRTSRGTSRRNVRLGSAFDRTTRASTSVPSARTTPAARPFRTRTVQTSAFVRIVAPYRRATAAMAFTQAPIPPGRTPHTPPRPSRDAPHHMMEEDQGRRRLGRTQGRADDAVCSQRNLQGLTLEPFA